ncbi:MAG: cytochrome c nitrite reductase small subunit [Planctomycetota bacterium]
MLAAFIGFCAGLGAFTFVYGHGESYLSTDPEACINCHIMNQPYDGWLKSPHHAVAVCVDCHLPHDGLAKWLSKADQGLRHSWGFTFNNFHEPIRLNGHAREIVNENCARCHADMVTHLVPTRDPEFDCIRCHASMAHGPVR